MFHLFSHFLYLCHCLCLCICVPFCFLNSYHNDITSMDLVPRADRDAFNV